MGLPVWIVIYVASGWKEAEYIRSRLAREGLLVMLRKCASADQKFSRQVELLVPEIEAREAHSIVMQLMGTVRA